MNDDEFDQVLSSAVIALESEGKARKREQTNKTEPTTTEKVRFAAKLRTIIQNLPEEMTVRELLELLQTAAMKESF